MCIWNILVDSILLVVLGFSKRTSKAKGLQYQVMTFVSVSVLICFGWWLQVTKLTSLSVLFNWLAHWFLLVAPHLRQSASVVILHR